MWFNFIIDLISWHSAKAITPIIQLFSITSFLAPTACGYGWGNSNHNHSNYSYALFHRTEPQSPIKAPQILRISSSVFLQFPDKLGPIELCPVLSIRHAPFICRHQQGINSLSSALWLARMMANDILKGITFLWSQHNAWSQLCTILCPCCPMALGDVHLHRHLS